jgi:lactoylglutathione lyase
LSDADIELSGRPITFPGGTSIFIRDPDKNVIEFHEPSKDTSAE